MLLSGLETDIKIEEGMYMQSGVSESVSGGVSEKLENVCEAGVSQESRKLTECLRRFGGYWRDEGMHDYCYLVNPFFPTKEFMDSMKDMFEVLMREYPSGMAVNSRLAADYFGVPQEYICVGNGTAELIKSLMENFTGKLGVIYPTFEEYPNRKSEEQLVPFYVADKDYTYTQEDIINYYEDKCSELEGIVLVNPDNPSGNFIGKHGLLRLVQWCQDKGIKLIVDESFVDFAKCDDASESDDAKVSKVGHAHVQSLIQEDILSRFKGLVVLKSISKSFGVPGLRLGVLATSDTELIKAIKKDVAIWNINSYAEYFMQIIGDYKSEYECALDKFKSVRCEFLDKLSLIKGLKVYTTEANYVMCRVNAGISSRQLAEIMLSRYNILIKDLSGKEGFDNGNYIRLSVKTNEENKVVIEALDEVLNEYPTLC